MTGRWLIVGSLALMLASPLLAEEPDRVREYLDRVTATLPAHAVQALEDIEGTPRKLLAARSYLRAGDNLRTRWSWTAEQIKAHTKSAEYRALLAETENVRRRFEAQNPGYTLYANTEARSLELQISRYNSNRSVERAANQLHKSALAEMQKSAYESPSEAQSVQRFEKFLTGWRPPTAAALAAPGISRHGQLRAIDFQIMKDGAIVAPTETATVKRNWDTPGWTEKLRVAAEGGKFRGPLQSPYEPWHYEYDP
ncbi:MAG: hypothetical protein ABW171_09240 [Steroidobacter sp.]